MKIIKKGEVPIKIYRIDCLKCGTIFEFEGKEANYNIGFYRDRDYLDINCPTCDKRCIVSV